MEPTGRSAPPRVVVHLGLSKTGTTSIQQTLRANRDVLGEHGIAVSARDKLTKAVRQGSVAWIEGGGPFRFARVRLALMAFRRRVRRMRFETLVISDESLIGAGSARLFAGGDPRGNLRLLDALERSFAGYEVVYVVYMRSLERWLASAYSQQIKKARHAQSFEDWLAAHADHDGPERFIDQLRARLGARLTVARMEDEIGPGHVLGETVFRLAGLSNAQISALHVPEVRNRSLPYGALEFIRILGQRGIRPRPLRRIARIARQNPELFSQGGSNAHGA
jgi:hypothetical protein